MIMFFNKPHPPPLCQVRDRPSVLRSYYLRIYITYIMLVATIIQVQKIDIAYSKTAKKIDVKKVKKAMWNIMSSTCDADKVRICLI